MGEICIELVRGRTFGRARNNLFMNCLYFLSPSLSVFLSLSPSLSLSHAVQFVTVPFSLAFLHPIRFCPHVHSIRTVPTFHSVLSSCSFPAYSASVIFGLAFVFHVFWFSFMSQHHELSLCTTIIFYLPIPSFTCETVKNTSKWILYKYTMSTASSSAPVYKGWVCGTDDKSPQGYIRKSNNIATTMADLKSNDIKEYLLSAPREHAELLHD